MVSTILDKQSCRNRFGQTLRPFADHGDIIGEVAQPQLRGMGNASNARQGASPADQHYLARSGLQICKTGSLRHRRKETA